MERPRHFEDYQLGESRKTYGRTITKTDFVVHAGHTGDFFPHHIGCRGDERLGLGPAHRPWHNDLAIGIGLTASEINPLAFSYGYERLRFPKPVFIGDTIHTELTIPGSNPTPSGRTTVASPNRFAWSTSAAKPSWPATTYTWPSAGQP